MNRLMSDGGSKPESIAALGAGRMGRGIAVVFAYAGHPVALIDFKDRPEADFQRLAKDARSEIVETLTLLSEIGLFEGGSSIERIAQPGHGSAEE